MSARWEDLTQNRNNEKDLEASVNANWSTMFLWAMHVLMMVWNINNIVCHHKMPRRHNGSIQSTTNTILEQKKVHCTMCTLFSIWFGGLFKLGFYVESFQFFTISTSWLFFSRLSTVSFDVFLKKSSWKKHLLMALSFRHVQY